MQYGLQYCNEVHYVICNYKQWVKLGGAMPPPPPQLETWGGESPPRPPASYVYAKTLAMNREN